MRKPKLAELQAQLRACEAELTAWRILWTNRSPDFSGIVDDGRTDMERWTLHGVFRVDGHGKKVPRATGPMLRIQVKGQPDRVMLLLDYDATSLVCPYRRSALQSCQQFVADAYKGEGDES